MKKKPKMKSMALSILLTLAMFVGLMPGMVMTAYAAGHTHSFTYSAEGDTITATCQNDGCSLTENKVTLTIGDPANIYYNDNTSSHDFTLVGLEDFNQATGKTISVSDIVYYKGDNTSQDIKNNKVKLAAYKARLTVEGVRAEHSFQFKAKPNPHTHSFSYTANGAVITATCTQNASNMEACDLPNKQATLTLNAPLHTTYGDGKDAKATLTGEIPGVTNPKIHYSKGDVTLSSEPTDVGTYKAWCQLGNATARVEYTITKAINYGWTTIPKAKQNLKYTGQPQALITAGTASAGNALYTVGTDPNNEPDRPYTSSVPEMTNAGTYYVWCKIDGGKNYTSINAQKVEVTIARADITPSVSIVGWTYGQTANTPMVGDTDNPGNGEVTYTYKVKDADDNTYKSTVPTAAGNYTVKAVIAETANYNSGVATKDFTISKAELTVTAKDQTIYVRDTVPDLSSPVLDTHYTVTGLVGEDTLMTAPTLAYQKDGNAATPDNTTAGTYDIVASGATASDNYTITYANGTLTISDKGTQTITADDVTVTYGDTDKKVSASVTDPTEGGGAISYAVKEGSGDYIDVDATTGALTIKKVPADGKAYVVVTAAGTATYEQATKDVTVTINKANSTVTKAPEAKTLTYNGQAQALVTAGEATGGTMQYALGTATEATQPYNTSIPTGIDAGTYYVWYKVVGDDNHNDSEPACVTVTIAKKSDPAPTPTPIPATASVTINSKTVSASTLAAAYAKAGVNPDSVATVVLGKKVKKIKKGAFKNFRNANTLVVKSKKLTRARVKGSLKGSTIKKVKVQVGKKKTNKKYVRKYKRIFTKKNAGKKVKVTR